MRSSLSFFNLSFSSSGVSLTSFGGLSPTLRAREGLDIQSIPTSSRFAGVAAGSVPSPLPPAQQPR